MQIYIARADRQLGVFNDAELLEKIKTGEILANDLAWVEGEDLWQPVSEFIIKISCANSDAGSPPSPHKGSVFISHASKNFKIADEVRSLLEERGISCWIAPRDIPPGGKYGTLIVEAIANCTVVVLLLTDEANKSLPVENEIELAFKNQKTIVPIRLRDIKPSKGLEFFVSNAQWVDAFVSPLKSRVDQIINIVHALELNKPLPGIQLEVPTFLGRTERQLERALRHKVLSMSVAFSVLALLGGATLSVQLFSQERLQTATTSITQSANRIDDAAINLEQSSTAIKSMDEKLDGVKKETSGDPKKELANRGVSWDEDSLKSAIARGDMETVALFMQGGMDPMESSDNEKSAPIAVLTCHPEAKVRLEKIRGLGVDITKFYDVVYKKYGSGAKIYSYENLLAGYLRACKSDSPDLTQFFVNNGLRLNRGYLEVSRPNIGVRLSNIVSKPKSIAVLLEGDAIDFSANNGYLFYYLFGQHLGEPVFPVGADAECNRLAKKKFPALYTEIRSECCG